MEILWWHWIVLGIVLMLLELAVPAFFLLWFGLGAVIVGVSVLAFPGLSFAWQIIIWTASSVLLIWLWFKVFKPNIHKTRAGLSRGTFIGEVGLVTKDIRTYERGQIRFQKPILGDEVWDLKSSSSRYWYSLQSRSGKESELFPRARNGSSSVSANSTPGHQAFGIHGEVDGIAGGGGAGTESRGD